MRVIAIAILAVQFAAAAAHAQNDVPPDIVVLETGAMVRGTVMQVDPSGDVVVQLPDGTERRFAAADIAYAGPAPGAPATPWIDHETGDGEEAEGVENDDEEEDQPETSGDVDDGSVELEIRGELVAAAAREGRPPSRLCIAPCTIRVGAGAYRFGVSIDDGFRLESTLRPVLDDATISIRHGNRTGLRIAGGAIVGIGLLGTAIGILGTVFTATSSSAFSLVPAFVSVLGISFTLTFGLGLPLAALVDGLRVVVVPADRATSL